MPLYVKDGRKVPPGRELAKAEQGAQTRELKAPREGALNTTCPHACQTHAVRRQPNTSWHTHYLWPCLR